MPCFGAVRCCASAHVVVTRLRCVRALAVSSRDRAAFAGQSSVALGVSSIVSRLPSIEPKTRRRCLGA
jgi:hypothetical protein